ncbi:MAG TPA: methionyl-tRNA formyltransferase [Stellaceae bacterium]|nr:methionyl-tRNA formyltransferase [Stellaceae bacterium]
MPRHLKIVFMGTPEFAATVLDGLLAAGHSVLAAYTQPPRPARRGHRLQPSPVQALAEARGVPVRAPVTLRDPETQAEFAALGADAAVVAAYGLILPAAVLTAPRLGCINVHASLLPRWRGAAPIQRAILAGDRETGVTIMQMEEGLDTGPILLQQAVPIGPETTAVTLSERLAPLGAHLVIEALVRAAQGSLTARPQPAEGITYARKIGREEAWLDWRHPAAALERQVRALGGGDFEFRGERIRVLAAAVLPEPPGVPGSVLDERLSIACGEGVFRPLRLQRPGRTAQEAPALLRGFAVPKGTVLACPATG